MNVIIRGSAINVKSSKSAEVGDEWHGKELSCMVWIIKGLSLKSEYPQI
jgi:hypothetical protein